MSKIHCFAQIAHFFEGNAEEEKEARQYLESWKKFTIRSLEKDCYRVKLSQEQYTEREPHFSGILCQTRTLALRIAVEIEFKLIGELTYE